MSARDMFLTQQTPLMKAPSTPSMTPTRSVRRRMSEARPRKSFTITEKDPSREARMSFSKSQPALYEDFYNLRTRNVPLSGSMSDLWAQYGLDYNPPEILAPATASQSQVVEQNSVVVKKENRSVLRRYCWGLPLVVAMILSAFLGVLMYVQYQQYFLPTSLCSPSLQIAQDVQVDRQIDQKIHSLQLEHSLLQKELEDLKNNLNKVQGGRVSEVISSPTRGVLEELLTADLACVGNLGSVLATPETTTVVVPTSLTLLFFTFRVKMSHRPPQTTIEGLIQEAGDCWPFEGSRGRLVLKLHRRSLVSGVSISHIPASVSVSDVSSAPRIFQVLVHRHEDDLENGITIGEFEYKTSGPWRQTFPVNPSNTKEDSVDIIEFRFLKNHGNPNYTCVYRVHVHGKPL